MTTKYMRQVRNLRDIDCGVKCGLWCRWFLGRWIVGWKDGRGCPRGLARQTGLFVVGHDDDSQG